MVRRQISLYGIEKIRASMRSSKRKNTTHVSPFLKASQANSTTNSPVSSNDWKKNEKSADHEQPPARHSNLRDGNHYDEIQDPPDPAILPNHENSSDLRITSLKDARDSVRLINKEHLRPKLASVKHHDEEKRAKAVNNARIKTQEYPREIKQSQSSQDQWKSPTSSSIKEKENQKCDIEKISTLTNNNSSTKAKIVIENGLKAQETLSQASSSSDSSIFMEPNLSNFPIVSNVDFSPQTKSLKYIDCSSSKLDSIKTLPTNISDIEAFSQLNILSSSSSCECASCSTDNKISPTPALPPTDSTYFKTTSSIKPYPISSLNRKFDSINIPISTREKLLESIRKADKSKLRKVTSGLSRTRKMPLSYIDNGNIMEAIGRMIESRRQIMAYSDDDDKDDSENEEWLE